jgi:hypothetical protein
MDTKELIPGLTVLAEFAKSLGRERLVDRNVDAAKPRAVHASERFEVGAGIDNRDVHRLADFLGFRFAGGNDATGLFEGNRVIFSFNVRSCSDD